MSIFKIEQNRAQQLAVKSDGFGNEFALRDFFAENLLEILGVRFLEKEYPTPDGRIDTLGIDENNAPTIIEYKWKENEEVFAQGLFYFDWLLKNKKHFELLAKSHLGQSTVVNWDQPRVILIAQKFEKYIKAAVQTVDNVELRTYKLHEGGVLQIESEHTPAAVKTSKHKKTENHEAKTTVDLSHHLSIASPEMQKRVTELREKILQLSSVEEKLGKSGIVYRTTKNFTHLGFRKNWIQVLLRESKYEEDTLGLVRDIKSNEWGYSGLVKLTPDTDLDYVFNLVKASHNSTL